MSVAGAGVVSLLSELFFVALAVTAGLALVHHSTRNDPRRSRRPVLWTVLAVYLAAATAVALVRTEAAMSAAPASAIQPIQTQTPERTFAPLVSLHSSEPIAPMSVDLFLRNSRLFWAFHSGCHTRKKFIAGPLTTPAQWRDLGSGGFRQAGDCGHGDVYATSYYTRPYDEGRTFVRHAPLTGREGFYLDLDQDALPRRRPATVTEDGQRVLEPSPVYFERHDETGKDGSANVRFTYWFFYPFNTPPGLAEFLHSLGLPVFDHEGDWERISVLTRTVGPDLWLPLSVRFHEHGGSMERTWQAVRKASDDTGVLTHPRAFVAKGDHATYPDPGRFRHILRVFGLRIPLDDEVQACRRCPRWATWKSPEMLVDATQQPWYGFGGAWGRVGSGSDVTGPLGPSIQKTLHGKAPSPGTAVPPAPPAQPAPG